MRYNFNFTEQTVTRVFLCIEKHFFRPDVRLKLCPTKQPLKSHHRLMQTCSLSSDYVFYRNREGIVQCIRPLPSNPDPTCQQNDVGMMEGTINSMVGGLGNMCGARKYISYCKNVLLYS